jgi:hypothetical protein
LNKTKICFYPFPENDITRILFLSVFLTLLFYVMYLCFLMSICHSLILSPLLSLCFFPSNLISLSLSICQFVNLLSSLPCYLYVFSIQLNLFASVSLSLSCFVTLSLPLSVSFCLFLSLFVLLQFLSIYNIFCKQKHCRRIPIWTKIKMMSFETTLLSYLWPFSMSDKNIDSLWFSGHVPF